MAIVSTISRQLQEMVKRTSPRTKPPCSNFSRQEKKKKMVSFKSIPITVFVPFNLYNSVAGSSPDLTVVYVQCNAKAVRGPGLVMAVEKVFHDVTTVTPLADLDFYC